MYQALYRKYRPHNFDEVIGQDIIVRTLKNAIINDKISHAYLFTGPRGTGKTSLAKIFAKNVNCLNKKSGEACNKCVICTLINKKQATDIIEIDAASNNGVDEIRNLKSTISLVPTNCKYKVYIIDEVHMLSTGAFNALLKTLEEPPEHVIFILATTEPQKLPATILSRCQRYDFKRISNEKIVERLKIICKEEGINADENALFEIARISDGGMRDSISILDQVISFKENDVKVEDIHTVNCTLMQKDLNEFIFTIFNKEICQTLTLLDKYNSEGKSISKLLDEIIYFLRNLLIFKMAPNYLKEGGYDITAYENLENILDTDIYSLLNNLNSLKNNIKDTSNVKTLFEIELLKFLGNNSSNNISQEIKNVPVEKTVEKTLNEKNKEKDVKKVIKEENKLNYPIDIDFINRRINNTLSKFSKKTLLDLKKKNDTIRLYLLDNDIGKYVALLLDGDIKAASDEYIIYVYKEENDVETFNNNLYEIEKVIETSLKEKYKVIATNLEEWEKIKDEFNNKKRKYEYVEEPKYELKIEKKSNENEIDNMFDNIVEYTEEEIK